MGYQNYILVLPYSSSPDIHWPTQLHFSLTIIIDLYIILIDILRITLFRGACAYIQVCL